MQQREIALPYSCHTLPLIPLYESSLIYSNTHAIPDMACHTHAISNPLPPVPLPYRCHTLFPHKLACLLGKGFPVAFWVGISCLAKKSPIPFEDGAACFVVRLPTVWLLSDESGGTASHLARSPRRLWLALVLWMRCANPCAIGFGGTGL